MQDSRQIGGTPVDAYRELGIDEGASLNEISRAYRRLVHDFHPDIHQGDPAASDRLRAIVRARDLILSSLRRTDRGHSGRDNAVADGAVRDITAPDIAVRFRGGILDRGDGTPLRGTFLLPPTMYSARQPDLVAGPVMHARAGDARGTDGY